MTQLNGTVQWHMGNDLVTVSNLQPLSPGMVTSGEVFILANNRVRRDFERQLFDYVRRGDIWVVLGKAPLGDPAVQARRLT